MKFWLVQTPLPLRTEACPAVPGYEVQQGYDHAQDDISLVTGANIGQGPLWKQQRCDRCGQWATQLMPQRPLCTVSTLPSAMRCPVAWGSTTTQAMAEAISKAVWLIRPLRLASASGPKVCCFPRPHIHVIVMR